VLAPPLQPALTVLDAARGRFYSALRPIARSVLAQRERRVALAGTALLASALIAASTLPLLLLALGPIVWGVPHLVSDLRYLVARPGLHKSLALYAAAAVTIGGSILGLGVRASLAGTIVAVTLGGGVLARRAAVAAGAGGLLFAASQSPWLADAIFLHAHNLVAFAYWLAWRKRSTRLHWLVVGAFAAGSAWLLVGPGLAIASAAGTLDAEWSGLAMRELAWALSPVDDPTWSLRFAMFFAFAQTAHYVVWLHLLPQDDARRGAPLTFSQGYRGLVRDVGAPLLWLAAAAALLVGGLAFVSLAWARDVYLGVAFFHAHLELIAGGLLLAGVASRDAT
jgi:hypothetical protein